MSGTVITFYSYKGGVGRSFIAANVAAQLCAWGYSVLCVDWDLEAPGLTEYFRPFITSTSPKGGLVDLVVASASDKSRPAKWSAYATTVRLPTGKLRIIAAGEESDNYARRAHDIRWQQLYDQFRFGDTVEELRAHWTKSHDFVIIDSRTGITDISGICTVQLPDVLALVVTSNNQSLVGGLNVVSRAVSGRSQLPYDRASLLTLPIVSKIDMREEYKLAAEWMEKLESTLRPLYSDWLGGAVPVRDIIQYTRVPYYPYWTYGERLPVVEERASDPESIVYYLHNVTALIAHGLADATLLAENRESYVKTAAKPRRTPGADRGVFAFDIFLSYARADRDFVQELVSALRRKGRVIMLEEEASAASDWQATLDEALSQARHMVVVWGTQPSRWQAEEARRFLSAALHASVDRRIIPIMRAPQSRAVMPAYLQQLRAIDAQEREPDEVARLVDGVLRR